MRLILKISANTRSVPFDYQKYLVGAFHKWLGKNDLHDDVSLYSLSWLQGGQRVEDGLDFKNGAEWAISTYDVGLLKKLIQNIQDDPEINFGMKVEGVTICQEPQFETKQRFILSSPVFIKRQEGERTKFYLFSDKESGELMTSTLKNKLKKAGLNQEGLKVYFDPNYQNPKTKLISFNGIDCRASMCPVIIEGSPEQLAFAWNVGIGNSTGIGFGALK
jgi:CRISPR-associated endoribonuclease Cas6